MDSDTDNEGLYDALPEMSDSSTSLCQESLASSSMEERNGPSLPVLFYSSILSDDYLPPPSARDEYFKNLKRRLTKKCTCRDDVHWMWDNDSKSQYVEIVNDRLDVRFHRTYSNGTAVVRCTEPMADNQYYWEVKITCPVYGTDIMVGVGTTDFELKHIDHRFVSLLGMDSKTWGFSYTGSFHHNGQRIYYGPSFGQGDIIGVHLDLWKGTLTFYKDRKCLGIASWGLKGKTFYAMASSTAARSGMRIVYSRSFPSSLQFLCCSKLRELIPDHQNVLDALDIPPGLKHFLANKLDWLLDKRRVDLRVSHCCRLINNQYDDEIDKDQIVSSFPYDPRPHTTREFLLLGSVLYSNFNRFIGAVANNVSPERGSDSESNAKRRRSAYNCIMGLSDPDSD